MARPVELSQRSRRLIARLGSRKTRMRESLVLVEGVRAVETALDAGAEGRFGVVSPRLDASLSGTALRARIESEGLPVHLVGDDELRALSATEASQGVLLVVAEPKIDLGDLRAPGRYLVLDGVQDPGNAGTLVRAAAAFALDGVVALDGTVDMWAPKSVRAAAGLGFSVPVVRADAGKMLAHLDQAGVGLLVADAGGQDVDTFKDGGPFALVVGNEGSGVRPDIVNVARAALSVPMPGPAESLNVAVAGSILLYSLFGKNTRG